MSMLVLNVFLKNLSHGGVLCCIDFGMSVCIISEAIDGVTTTRSSWLGVSGRDMRQKRIF